MHLAKLKALNGAHFSLLFAAAMCCLPFVIAYHHIPMPSFYGEWVAALCGLLAAIILLRPGFWQSPALPASTLIFIGLWLLSLLQSSLGRQPAVSSLPLIQSYLLWGALLCIAGAQLRSVWGWHTLATTLAYALMTAGAINAVFTGLQIAQQFGLPVHIGLPTYGMLGQNNHFADLTALAMISLCYLHLAHRISRPALNIGLWVGLLMLTLSGSRSSLLYLAAMAFWSWRLHLSVRDTQPPLATPTRRLLYTCLGLFPAFIALQVIITLYFPQALTPAPMMRAADLMASHAGSLRWQFWQTSLNLFQQSPLWGVGTGQMRWQTFLLADQASANPAHIFFEHAHNLFLHLLAESGLFAPLMVLGGLSLWLWRFLHRQALQPCSWWLLTILSVIGIHSMLEYPLWYSFFLGITALLLGAGDNRLFTLRSPTVPLKKLLGGTLLALILYGGYQLLCMYHAYQLIEKQIAMASQPMLSAVQKQTLVEEMVWVSDHTLLAPGAELVLATFLSPHEQYAAAQLPLVESAVRFIPLRRPVLNMIILLEMTHRHAEALQHLRTLRRIAGPEVKNEIMRLPPEHIPGLLLLLREAEAQPTSRTP